MKRLVTTRTKLFEIIGWYGVAAILLAYALVSFDVITPHEWVYQLLNFTGATGVMLVSIIKQARQPAVLNFVWAIIALTALINIVK